MFGDDSSTRNGNNADSNAPADDHLERMLDGLLGQDATDAPAIVWDDFSAADALPPDEETELSGHSKVELDIDDAPFLDDLAEPEPLPARKAEPALPEAVKDTGSDKKEHVARSGWRGFSRGFFEDKKRLALSVGAACLILLAPLVFLLATGDRQRADHSMAVATSPLPKELSPQQTPPSPAEPKRFVFQSNPFLVPLRGSEGEMRFLRLRYALTTENPQLFAELQMKIIPIRDAVYHYLSKKSLPLGSGEEQVQFLRTDLIHVINQQVSADKLDELHFEEYLITGSR